jgi:adenylate kinase family enzyme
LLGSAAVQRVSMVGISGSGKSTLGRELTRILGLPHLELDSVFHQAGWVSLSDEEFRRQVAIAVAQPQWVLDGNYHGKVQPIIWARADTVIWVDMPRHIVMRRVIARTLHRMAGRVELWNGNREHWRQLLNRDKEENVILWAWHMHGPQRERYTAAMADPANARLRFIQLTSPAAVRRFLEELEDARAAAEPAGTSGASGASGSGGD